MVWQSYIEKDLKLFVAPKKISTVVKDKCFSELVVSTYPVFTMLHLHLCNCAYEAHHNLKAECIFSLP